MIPIGSVLLHGCSWAHRTGAKHEKRTALWEDARPQMWCMPDHPISGRGIGEIVSPSSVPIILPRKGSLSAPQHLVLWGTETTCTQEYSEFVALPAEAA